MKNIDILSSLLKDYVTGKVVGIYVYEILKRKNYKNLSTAIEAKPQIVDEIILELIQKDNELIHRNLLKNIDLPSNIINKIANNTRNSYSLSLIVKHNNCPFELSEEIALNNSNIGIRTIARQALARYPNISLKILQEFTLDTNYSVRISAREAIAKHPNTTLEELEKLAFDAEPKVKKAVASRSDLPIDLIEKMAADRQIIAKKFLLRNKFFSESLLTTLSESSEPKVIQMVALHPNTPITLLNKLAKVPSAKSFVAQNSNVTVEILEDLSESDEQEVQLAVVKNHLATSEILGKIAFNTSNSEILIPIIENNNTQEDIKAKILEKLFNSSSLYVRKYVAQNPYTPESILTYWSQSKAFIKLYPWLAKNPKTLLIFLEIFSKKFCSKNVAIGLAKNPNTSREIIEYLTDKYRNKHSYGYFYDDVRFALAMNVNSPGETRNGSFARFDWRKLPYSILNNLYFFGDTLLKIIQYNESYDHFLLSQNNLPSKISEYILRRQSNNRHLCDRKFVARHPKTPTEILEKLTKDTDMGVCDAAKYRLEQLNL